MDTGVAVHHLHYCFRDPKAAGQWFADMLGARITKEGVNFFGGATGVLVDLAGANLFFRGPRPDEKPGDGKPPASYGFDHIGLRVADMDKLAAHLRAKGVKFEVDVHEFRPGVKVAFITGPDGVRIELSENREASAR
jgi:catechol 2,3-dioxygenase-like lactoylglutathione lyase family enzyme